METSNEKLSPSAQNKVWAQVNFQGSLAIYTIVSGDYQWYLPLWFYCIKKAWPAATPIAYVRGAARNERINNASIFPDFPAIRKNTLLDAFPDDGYTTAALRFTYDDKDLRSFDYTLITDCDILMQTEDPSIINQHMRMCCRFGLNCYHNYISARTPDGPKVPGVHFVSKLWWDKTAEVRAAFQQELLLCGARSWDYDELMLYRIIKKSHLPEPPDEYHIWAHHGVHLGDYRRRIENKQEGPPPHGHHQTFIRQLLVDREFMALVDECAPHLKNLKQTFELFKRY